MEMQDTKLSQKPRQLRGDSMDNYIYLGVTVVAVIFAVGTFVGINNMSFKVIAEKLESMDTQIKEVRANQEKLNDLTTRITVVEKGVEHLEKCQDHLQTDMTLIKKRQVRKIED